MTYVLFDIGGTKTRVAISNDLTTIEKIVNFKTPMVFADGVKKIISSVKDMTDEEPKAFSGGIRGLLSDDKTGLFNDAVLDKWAGKSLVAEIQKTFNVPVYIENDTAMAGLGEAVFGAGKGLDIIAYHTVSTGVGGVKIEHEMIDEASSGFEPGHQVLDIDRTILGDDIVPTLENLVSGTAVEQRFGVKAYEIRQDDVLWNELAEYLAQGLRNTILYWSPDVIVLGGSMIIGDPAIPIDMIRKCTVDALDGFVPAPLICAAKLKDEAGIYGAMALLSKKLA